MLSWSLIQLLYKKRLAADFKILMNRSRLVISFLIITVLIYVRDLRFVLNNNRHKYTVYNVAALRYTVNLTSIYTVI